MHGVQRQHRQPEEDRSAHCRASIERPILVQAAHRRQPAVSLRLGVPRAPTPKPIARRRGVSAVQLPELARSPIA